MTKLDVINNALLKAGLPFAATQGDEDWNALFVFDKVVGEILRGYGWGFASKYAALNMDAGAPVHGFKYSYSLPADCIRMIDVHCQTDLRSPKARYKIAGRKLLTNASPCYVRYVSDDAAKDEEIDSWPMDFMDAVAFRIALEITTLSGENMAVVPQLTQQYQISLGTAQLNDARESMERVPLEGSIQAARGGQG